MTQCKDIQESLNMPPFEDEVRAYYKQFIEAGFDEKQATAIARSMLLVSKNYEGAAEAKLRMVESGVDDEIAADFAELFVVSRDLGSKAVRKTP